jgi:putative membrane protein
MPSRIAWITLHPTFPMTQTQQRFSSSSGHTAHAPRSHASRMQGRTCGIKVPSVAGIGTIVCLVLAACGGDRGATADSLRADSMRADSMRSFDTLPRGLDTVAGTSTPPGVDPGVAMGGMGPDGRGREGVGGANQAAAGTPLSDANILHVLSTANRLDSTSGAAAQSRLREEPVKAFAQRLVRDHGAMRDSVRRAASATGSTPAAHPLSTSLEELSARGMTSNTDFDRAYIENEVMMHQTLLRIIDETLVPQASDQRVKLLLASTRRTVAGHLEEGEALRARVGGR